MKYFFILGRQPELSMAEILAKLNQQKIGYKIESQTDFFLVIEIENEFNEISFFHELAGSIKTGKIIEQASSVNSNILIKLIPEKETKINFGISSYNSKIKTIQLGKEIKKELKESGKSARFVTDRNDQLSSVTVSKNKLLTSGIEFVLLQNQDNYFIGKTTAVQNFEQFSHFDYDRPNRDLYVGMLPPKLAQIMINLSGAKHYSVLLDPFCGGGTVLQQAILLGLKNLIGSDVSLQSIKSSQQNLEWLESELHKKIDCHLYNSDIKKLDQQLPPKSIDIIVTEPYLGPPVKGSEPTHEIKRTLSDLTKLYRQTFHCLEKLLKPNGTIVIIIPQINIKGETFSIDVPFLLPPNLEIKDQWSYSRPKQHITRLIYKITKK